MNSYIVARVVPHLSYTLIYRVQSDIFQLNILKFGAIFASPICKSHNRFYLIPEEEFLWAGLLLKYFNQVEYSVTIQPWNTVSCNPRCWSLIGPLLADQQKVMKQSFFPLCVFVSLPNALIINYKMNYYSAPREELFDKPVCVWGSTLDKSILLLGLFIILL